MGYTHYWYRVRAFEAAPFRAAIGDLRQLWPQFAELGIPLAGSDGHGASVLTDAVIAFNGSVTCGHPANQDIVIPWPTKEAGGVATTWKDFATAYAGQWFAGADIRTRVCNGDCSYESFVVERVMEPQSWERSEGGYAFACCKTAFRPYDLAVTAALVILQHHLGRQLRVSSDGDAPHRDQAQLLCQMQFGYGLDFHLED